ncbi:MAG: hypothetical protein Q9217_002107 [Psora testacea]
MTSPKPLLAFYGATGGSCLAALVPALQAGYDCTALARKPSKLTNLLLSKGILQSAINTHLHITQGDVLSVEAVKGPLALNGRPADIIISGIGITTFGQSRQEVTICANALTNIMTALREINAQAKSKPLLVALSSTGITQNEMPRDLPVLMMPFYHCGLKNPHADKIAMEKIIESEMSKGEEAVVRGFVLPRPSLLTNGKAKGSEKVRVGDEEKPAVGYTISRDDVGWWIFESLVQKDAQRWVGKKPSLTY